MNKFDTHFMRLAIVAAYNLSKDPDTKVGAVITSPDARQLSIGYNGFPVGIAEPPERWQRPEKYKWVIHAEINAIMNCPFDTKDCTLYCTHQSCPSCLGAIINARIRKIVYSFPYLTLSNEDLIRWKELSEHIEVVQIIDNKLIGLANVLQTT